MDPKISPSNFHTPPKSEANALSSIPFLPFVVILFIVSLCAPIILLRQHFQFLFSIRSSTDGGATAGGGVNSTVPHQSTEVGLDSTIIASFPMFLYAELRQLIEGKYGCECAVCLSEFAAGDVIRLLTVCCHAFHQGCIDSWLISNRTCPLCRSDLEATPDEATVRATWEVVASDDGGEE